MVNMSALIQKLTLFYWLVIFGFRHNKYTSGLDKTTIHTINMKKKTHKEQVEARKQTDIFACKNTFFMCIAFAHLYLKV